MIDIGSIMEVALTAATPIIYAMVGTIFAERSGVLNIGIEGIMLLSASVSLITALYTQNLVAGLVAAILVGVLLGLLIAIASISLHLDQTVLGIGFWLVGISLSSFLHWYFVLNTLGSVYIKPFDPINIPLLLGTPLAMFSKQNWMVYGAILLAVFSFFIFRKTTFGLKVVAVGENPSGADLLGINVFRMRYVSVIISCAIAGVAGSFYTLGYIGSWTYNITSGSGFIAISLARLGNWNPLWGMAGALIFGATLNIQFILQLVAPRVPFEFFQTLPYLTSIILLIVISKVRKKPPKSLGVPYLRDKD